jgi:hypothetical protein
VEITFGQRRTSFLRPSAAMKAMDSPAAAELLAVPPQEAEGLLYMMLRLDDQDGVVPLNRAPTASISGLSVSVRTS